MAEAAVGDKFAQVRGFLVEIESAGGGKEVDTAWESVSGGELIIEQTEPPPARTSFRPTSRAIRRLERSPFAAR